MKKNSKSFTEEEKQRNPMPGEVSPDMAAAKAREFAALEKTKLRNKK